MSDVLDKGATRDRPAASARKQDRRQLYGGYFKRDVPDEDAELTHVGPGTVGGEFMRRFWQPVVLSEELKDFPVALKILGEDLVAFRDRGGRVGVLHKHCSHRAASLEFGIIEDRGLRCCYHGWLYGADGEILDTPGEPADSPIKDTLSHGAYPVVEKNGLVFAYLGPPDDQPAFPVKDTDESPDNLIKAFSTFIPANWLQQHENNMDPAHAVFLHTRAAGPQFTPVFGEMPVLEFQETNSGNGMIYIASRRVDDHVWVRTFQTLLPNHSMAPSFWAHDEGEVLFRRVCMDRWSVPHDDESHTVFAWRHFNDRVDPNGEGDPDRVGKEKVDFIIGQTGDRTYAERQSEPGDWDVWVSQRPIAVHAKENLGTTDGGVAMFRRILRSALRAETPPMARLGDAARPLNTYSQDTILRIPKRGSDDEDREMMRLLGRKVVDVLFEGDVYSGDARDAFIRGRLATLKQ